MKGIVHFAVGVAWASCSATAVAAGTDGNPLYFLLGGICGLLPDTLDFKFSRFRYRHDIMVIPDPLRPDPGMIADAVASAATRASESGHPVSIKLETMRVGADLWRQYRIRFDTARRAVEVEIGPVVSTGRLPVRRGEGETARSARAALPCDLRLDYFSEIEVDIFDGPHFHMVREPDGAVRPEFIPWHREWSHGLVLSVMLGMLGWLAWGRTAGAVMAGAHALHWLVDQVGYMGNNLLYPFTRRRAPGLKWAQSGEPNINAAIVWFCMLAIFWNLLRRGDPGVSAFGWVPLFTWGFLLPAALTAGVARLLKRWRSPGQGLPAG